MAMPLGHAFKAPMTPLLLLGHPSRLLWAVSWVHSSPWQAVWQLILAVTVVVLPLKMPPEAALRYLIIHVGCSRGHRGSRIDC